MLFNLKKKKLLLKKLYALIIAVFLLRKSIFINTSITYRLFHTRLQPINWRGPVHTLDSSPVHCTCVRSYLWSIQCATNLVPRGGEEEEIQSTLRKPKRTAGKYTYSVQKYRPVFFFLYRRVFHHLSPSRSLTCIYIQFIRVIYLYIISESIPPSLAT